MFSSKANKAGQQSIRDAVFRSVENDDSGTIDAHEFAVLYEAIKRDLEEDLEKQAALEKEASSATRRFKMLLLFVAVLISFLAASVAANFAVLFTFVDSAITTATTGSGMLEVKGSDTIIKTAIATQDVPLMAAPALDIDTLSEVKSLKVVYSSTLGERIEAQLTVVGVRKHNSTFVEFVTSVGGETVEALNGVASLVRYPTNANRLTTPMKHAICSANATCSAFRTRGIDVGAALDLARAELEKSGFQNAARRLSPTLDELNCFFGWWTWSACGIFGGLPCPFGSVMNALAYFYTGYSWFAKRHVVFFAHGWTGNAATMWMRYCTFGVMWCPILELNEFRHLVFVFPTSFINGYLEPGEESNDIGGWGLAWNHPLTNSLKFEMGTDELAALMCGNSNAFELEWCWGFGWLGLFGVDDSSEVMIIGFSNGAGLATFANWAYGTTVTKSVAIDYHNFWDYSVWLPAVHAVSGAAGFNLKLYEACASWTFSTDGIWEYGGEMTFGSGAQTLTDNCDLGVTTGGPAAGGSVGFDPLCYKSYGGFGYGYLPYKEFSWSESAPGTRKLVWAVHGFNETNHCALNEMAVTTDPSSVHMFVPYFVGIIHDVLEWVDAATYGSWTVGGSGLPPYPPSPPSPSPPPFPPTSSWFLGIAPLKPILKPDPVKAVGFGWVYNPEYYPGDPLLGLSAHSVNAQTDWKSKVVGATKFQPVTWAEVFKNSMALGNKQDSALTKDQLTNPALDQIGGLSRKSIVRVKEYCIDELGLDEPSIRRLDFSDLSEFEFDPDAPLDPDLHCSPQCIEGEAQFKQMGHSTAAFCADRQECSGCDFCYDPFADVNFDKDSFEKIVKLTKKHREKLKPEFRGQEASWDFDFEKEVKKQFYYDKLFVECMTQKCEVGQRTSVLLQKELSIMLDEERYANFYPEEIGEIFGKAEVGGKVNVISFGVKPPKAFFDLPQEKQNIVREDYYDAIQQEVQKKASKGVYAAPEPEPVIEEQSLDAVKDNLIAEGYDEAELDKRKDENGNIRLCKETNLPPEQTDTLAETLKPVSDKELTEALELQFDVRSKFELFDPESSGIKYPFRECKPQHGCFPHSDFESQVEFMEQQDKTLDALRTEVDMNDPLGKTMTNIKQSLKIISGDNTFAPVRLLGAGVACFSRTTTACRLLQPASAGDAYSACFGGGLDAVAERVSMDALVAGDTVLADGAALTRVVVNQHAGVEAAAPMLTLHFEGGSLSLTSDHVLLLDGALAPARLAAVGSVLSSGRKVSAVTHGSQGVVNPITVAGTILAAGPSGDPVVAATANEWLADVLLSAYPKYTLSFTLAVLFPASVQAYHDSTLEPLFSLAVPRLERVKAAAPVPAVAAGLVLGDVLLATGLFAFCIGKLAIVAAIAAASLRRKA